MNAQMVAMSTLAVMRPIPRRRRGSRRDARGAGRQVATRALPRPEAAGSPSAAGYRSRPRKTLRSRRSRRRSATRRRRARQRRNRVNRSQHAPNTVNGCRPVSVVIQPASTATKPAGPIIIANTCSSRDWNSRPRHRIHRLSRPSPRIRNPRPTMTRKRPERDRHRRQFSRGTVSRPASGASGECLRISEDIFGISTAYLTSPAA